VLEYTFDYKKMPPKLIILDAVPRINEIKAEYRKRLEAHQQQIRRLKNKYFLRKVYVKRGDKTYVYEKYYRYGYFKVEDSEEEEVVIPLNLSNLERYRFIRQHRFKRKMVYVGAKKPKVDIPEPPENPLEGLSFERKKNSVIVDSSVYDKHKNLFEGLEVFELK